MKKTMYYDSKRASNLLNVLKMTFDKTIIIDDHFDVADRKRYKLLKIKLYDSLFSYDGSQSTNEIQ